MHHRGDFYMKNFALIKCDSSDEGCSGKPVEIMSPAFQNAMTFD